MDALDEALRAIDPYELMASSLRVRHGQLIAGSFTASLSKFSRILVLAVGKASVGMMRATIDILGGCEIRGVLVTPKDGPIPPFGPNVRIYRAAHPIPDGVGLEAGRTITRTVTGMRDDELLLCLLSGGASALLPSPAQGVTLKDERRFTRDALDSKATIHEINTVRRHLSTLKGGQLVQKCPASSILSLIVSDVPRDQLPDIASGLTAEDPTTYRDAIEVLQRHSLWSKIPQSMKNHLYQGLSGKAPETAKPGEPIFSKVRNIIIANNATACNAAKRNFHSKGIRAKILTSSAEMEAKQMGQSLSLLAIGCKLRGHPFSGSGAVIMGGETTVDVKGDGKGGRNQESVLWATRPLMGFNGTVVAALGTDGIDGNSDAAGAITDGNSATRAKGKRMNPENYLARNDSYRFFKALGDNLVTGRTGSNVGDVYLMVSIN